MPLREPRSFSSMKIADFHWPGQENQSCACRLGLSPDYGKDLAAAHCLKAVVSGFGDGGSWISKMLANVSDAASVET
jgi:hypothetical protein